MLRFKYPRNRLTFHRLSVLENRPKAHLFQPSKDPFGASSALDYRELNALQIDRFTGRADVETHNEVSLRRFALFNIQHRIKTRYRR